MINCFIRYKPTIANLLVIISKALANKNPLLIDCADELAQQFGGGKRGTLSSTDFVRPCVISALITNDHFP